MKFQADKLTKPCNALSPVSTNSAALAGIGVDTKGWREALIIAQFGLAAGGTRTVKVQESDDDGVLDAYADVAGATFAAVTTSDDVNLYVGRLDLGPRKRYLRVYHTGDGANACVVAATILLVDPQYPIEESQQNTRAFNVY